MEVQVVGEWADGPSNPYQYLDVMNKSKLNKTLVGVYIFVSLGAIGFLLLNNFKVNLVTDAYSEGRVEVISKIIEEAETNCQPFPISLEDKQVGLVNVECLKIEEDL